MTTIEALRTKWGPKLLKALATDAAKISDCEGRSQLDFLIIELQNMTPKRRADWTEAVADVVRSQSSNRDFNWSGIERLVVLGGLQSPALGTVFEEALAERRVKDPQARAIIYSLLDDCGMPPSAATISGDEQLRIQNRLLWLDLMITRIPRLEDAQQLVLDAISDDQFSVEDFRVRLSEMRNIGGKRLGDWIRTLRSKFNENDLPSFDTLIDKAFGPLTQLFGPEDESENSDPDARSVRTLALLDPIGASLPVGLAFRRWRPTTRHRRYSAQTKALMALIQKAVSYNRDSQLQYNYLAGRKYHFLRKAFSVSKPEIKQVEDKLISLLEFLNCRFYEATAKNFEMLHAYYASKGGVAPRISLKGTFRVDASETVVSIFRDHEVNYQNESDTSIERNTGFHHIKNSGNYFLENNIPRATLEGRYVNPRLKTDVIHSTFRREEHLNELVGSWDRYWTGYEEGQNNNPSNYMSTLIVPLTLSKDNLSDEFRAAVPLGDIERTVFGFLCFDHREIDYFDESTDVSVGQMFAGFLCHFVFTRLVYTDMSKTFRQVSEFLGNRVKMLNLHKVDQLTREGHLQPVEKIREQLEAVPNTFTVHSAPMTDAPKLQDFDQVLFNFAVNQPLIKRGD